MIRVVTLGTGSGKPTPERNVSSTAVFREGELILFDCGEGTQIQITKAGLRPGALSVICITHFHGDHINGLPGLLGTLQMNQREEPLTLIGPKGIANYVKTLSKLGVLGFGYKLNIIEVAEAGVVYDNGSFSIAADRLSHRVLCWGYRLAEPNRPGRFQVERAKALGVPPGPMFGQLQRGQSVVLDDGSAVEPEQVLGPARRGLALAYCCDTVPCDGAQRLAAGVDLLIHEGTYAPNESKIAHDRGHSTMLDAAKCAANAGVGRLIITHISPKYTPHSVGQFAKNVRNTFANTAFATDLDSFELAYAD